MSHVELCTKRIQQVRALTNDPELAYATRTRLNRAILSCTRLVANGVGLLEPLYPGRYDIPSDAPLELRRLCEITNRLIDRSRSICQPSEPLDERWSNGWSEIVDQLNELELSLSKVERELKHAGREP